MTKLDVDSMFAMDHAREGSESQHFITKHINTLGKY